MELSLTSPIVSNAAIFRRTKNSITKVAPKNKCGGNWRREVACLVAHGDGVKTVTMRCRGPLSKAKEGYMWSPTGPLPALTGTRTFKGSGPSETSADKSDSFPTKVLEVFHVLIAFLRPYVLHMALVPFAGISIRTWMENAHLVKMSNWTLLLRTMAVVVAMLCSEGFTSGINHIYDVDINKINKPHYPLASGALSIQSARILVICFIIIGIAISVLLKSGSIIAYVFSHLVFGTLYSVPPFSFKRSTIGAILLCAFARGCALNLCLSALAKNIMGLPFQLSPQQIFLAIFSTLFIVGFTPLKDIEDLEGDKKYNVPTLASIYGPRKVAIFGFAYMVVIYIGAIATAIVMPKVFRQSIMIPSHMFLALYLIFQAWKLEKANYTKEASVSIYQSVLKLYIFEFILFPFI